MQILSCISPVVSRVELLTAGYRIPIRLFGWSRTHHWQGKHIKNRILGCHWGVGKLEKRQGENHDRKYFHGTACHLCNKFTPTPPNQDPSLEWERSGQEFLNGPDQVLPSSATYTWHVRGAVRLSTLGTEPGVSSAPVSAPTMLLRAAEKSPNIVALALRRENNQWAKWTYEDYYEDCRTVAKAFIALGLEPFHGVCILGFNSPEWFIANMGSIFAGGIPAGIYTTNTASACAYIARDSQACIYVVSDEKQLSKVLQCRDKMTHLKAIVQYQGSPGADGVLSWQELMDLGAQQSDEVLNQRLRKMAVNQCASLIYTSGTTGHPKGVMLSHDNMTWLAHRVEQFGRFDDGVQEVVSYLPLSHVAAQHADIYVPLVADATVYFADPDALQGSLIHTLVEVQPTSFVAVPRVWEKIYEQLQEISSKNRGIKTKVASWAKSEAIKYHKLHMTGREDAETFQFKLADRLILSKVKHALGLSRSQINVSAAAPINVDILRYFRSLNIIIGEGYGLSETSGPCTMSLPHKKLIRFESVGKIIDGIALKLDKMSKGGEGELCYGGRSIMMGYLNHEKKTRNAIDAEGWLHSEDVGRIDEDGYIFVTGRIKELLITAGGENVAPVPIEDNIKSALPCLSNAMLVGDRLKFLSVLITFKTEIDPKTNEPSDKLTSATKKWIDSHGACDVHTVKDVLSEVYQKKNSKLINSINSGVMLANTKCVSRASRVRKWVILPKDFSISGGELGPTLKLKRTVATQKYHNLIQDLYMDGLDPNSTGALG